MNITVEARVGRVTECRSRRGLKTLKTSLARSKDALVKPLKVKPEGVPVEVVESEFKCLKKGSSWIKMRRLSLPSNTVADSGRAWLQLTGDMMAPSLENLGNLVKLPTGCGEQNMIRLVPNIYLLDYLKGTNQSKPGLERRAKVYMDIGYKRQEAYAHKAEYVYGYSGAYSVWGNRKDKNTEGSSWLTAFVVKSFSEAAKHMSVDAKLVEKSIYWLMKSQLEDGCFKRIGYVHAGSSLTYCQHLKFMFSDAEDIVIIPHSISGAVSRNQVSHRSLVRRQHFNFFFLFFDISFLSDCNC